MPRNLLVIYSGDKQEDNTLRYTNVLAENIKATNVKGLLIVPSFEVKPIANLLNDSAMGLYTRYLDELETSTKKFQQKTVDNFKNLNLSNIKLSSEIGNPSEISSYWGKFSDIIICNIEIGKKMVEFEGVITSCLFNTGSLVLIHPTEYIFKKLENIIIAWDGSFRASDAVKSSLQILKQAKNITILTIDETMKDLSSVLHLMEYLESHSIQTNHKNISKVNRCIGDEIINEAKKQDADLIIMGAYNHNKMRQIVLGGATKFILSYSTIPVLLKH